MPPSPQYWLIKSEPSVYPYSRLETEGRTAWTGVRNFEARNNLKAMVPGDLCLYYHSNEGKEIVGVARLLTRAAPDPTAKGAAAPSGAWVAVDVGPLKALERPVTLAEIREHRELADFPLLTRSRLSVASVSGSHFRQILKLGKTRL